MRRKYNLTYQLPILLTVFYLVCTLILYEIGPLDWITYNPVYFWFLQIVYIVMLVLGWQTGIKKTYISKPEWTVRQDKKVIKTLKVLLKINLLYESVNLFRKFNMSSFDISGLIKNILFGFSHMGEAYNSLQDSIGAVEGGQVVGSSVMTLFNYIWEFAAFAVVLLGGYYFKKLKTFDKIIYILTCIIILIDYISTGTNIGVFRLILAVLVFGSMKVIQGKYMFSYNKWKKRKKLILCVAIILAVIMTVLFDKIMKSRGGILLWDTSYYNIGGIGVDKDSVLFKIVSPRLYMLLVSATSYLTQGYYGMSLCLRVNWMPTFGVGHSMFAVKMLSEYVSDMIQLRTYQNRIAVFGWEEDVRWHSIYTWFANDISFIGVIAVMFLIGYFFAMAYKDSLQTNNPFAYVMVYFFTLMVFFFPCNNQIFQSSYTMFSFWTVFILWLCTRGRKKFKIRRR